MDNEKNIEITKKQMEKVSGGVNDEFIVFRCGDCGYEFIPEGVTLCCPNCGGHWLETIRT